MSNYSRHKSLLGSFVNRYIFWNLLRLLWNDHVVFLVRWIPSYEGILIRRFVYKSVMKKLGKKSLIFPDARMDHAFEISAGDYFGINSGAHLDGRGGIEMGDYVLIGPNVFIGSANHAIKSDDNAPRIFEDYIKGPIKIGSHVWIGANAVICPGVKIGFGSIVGAGSVVIDDVPDNVLVVGNPARVVKNI